MVFPESHDIMRSIPDKLWGELGCSNPEAGLERKGKPIQMVLYHVMHQLWNEVENHYFQEANSRFFVLCMFSTSMANSQRL